MYKKLPTVYKYQNASILNKPTAVVTLISSFLWFTFGLSISDPFIFFPNGIGFISAFILLFSIYKFDKSSYSTVYNGLENNTTNTSLDDPQQTN
ncbi:hypothetical protein BB561_003961 [Smittium simulii]|uniref:Uncharacterized protein n=1 Tax=Smittium simulii TaxID=133385 RepID=A0A2T9YIT2_9FUNG|nr:hypothetical protein BB561_003961 [Smittium simulii]